MRYWVFTEAQRNTAITAFVERLKRDKFLVHNAHTADKLGEAIKIFLESPEARAHKLIGGASYEPEATE